jgi:hypothetical protein
MAGKGKGKMPHIAQAVVIDLQPSSLYVATEEPPDESQRFQWTIVVTDSLNTAKRYQWQAVPDGPFAERYTEEYCGTVMNVNFTRTVIGYFKIVGYIHADERLVANVCQSTFLEYAYGFPSVAENRLLNLSSRPWVLNVLSGLMREGHIVGRGPRDAEKIAGDIVREIGDRSEEFKVNFVRLFEELEQVYESPVTEV